MNSNVEKDLETIKVSSEIKERVSFFLCEAADLLKLDVDNIEIVLSAGAGNKDTYEYKKEKLKFDSEYSDLYIFNDAYLVKCINFMNTICFDFLKYKKEITSVMVKKNKTY